MVSTGTNFWLKKELEKFGYRPEVFGIQNYNIKDESRTFGKIRMWVKYLRVSLSGIRAGETNDIIITDNFVIGAITAFICQLRNKKRKIISLNMIAHHKGFLNRSLRKIIYNRAFKYKSFWFSVNDEQLIEPYSKEFKFPRDRIFILHDPFYETDERKEYVETGDYVFTGGDAFRDWKAVVNSAKELPTIKFIGVARYKYFPHELSLPENLMMHFDISSDKFYSLLKQSKIVFLPLNSMAPCGLIVMMKAALLSKPVIITETPSTKNYVADNVSGRLIKMNDTNEMINAVAELYNSKDKRIVYASNLKNHILENFSTEKNAKIIKKIILA